jgi:hypothetical protein
MKPAVWIVVALGIVTAVVAIWMRRREPRAVPPAAGPPIGASTLTRDEFWALIDDARAGARDCEQIAKRVEALLTKRPAAQIAAFMTHQDQLLAQAYTWELWGAAYIVGGGASDDGFEYFRAYLLTRGRDAFELALRDPDALAGVVESNAECEDMLHAAWTAYERVAGREPPPSGVVWPELDDATSWDFDDEAEMKRRYPRLWAKFAD